MDGGRGRGEDVWKSRRLHNAGLKSSAVPGSSSAGGGLGGAGGAEPPLPHPSPTRDVTYPAS